MTIYASTVADRKDDDLLRLVVHAVDDPVVSDSYALFFPLPRPTHLDSVAGSGIFGKSFHS